MAFITGEGWEPGVRPNCFLIFDDHLLLVIEVLDYVVLQSLNRGIAVFTYM